MAINYDTEYPKLQRRVRELEAKLEKVGGLVQSVNAFMASCEESEVKIPFVPCGALLIDMKAKVVDAEAALK